MEALKGQGWTLGKFEGGGEDAYNAEMEKAGQKLHLEFYDDQQRGASVDFSVIDAEGKVQAQLDAMSVQQACRQWASRCWDEAIVESSVHKARIYVLDDQSKSAHMDPYLICPAGRESECISRHKREFRQDLKAGSTYGAPAQPFDSGGQG